MMRPSILFISLLMLLATAHAENTTCVECATFANASAAHVLPAYEDPPAQVLDINVYTEDFTASPSRQGVNNTIVIVEVTNSTSMRKIYKTYTNDSGTAKFDYGSVLPSNYNGCINIKMLYCPFCNPNSSACGFSNCLNYSKISAVPDYYEGVSGAINSADDIPDATGQSSSSSGVFNENRYFPDVQAITYCTPPPALANTPALCLPLLIIFSLLSGALYLTGKNPFAGFNIGGQRVGRHIRYQARGRGFSLNVMSVASAAMSIGQGAKTLATPASKGGGMKGLVANEKKAAEGRVFLAGDISRAGTGVSALKSASAASKGKGAKGGAQTMSRHMEARMSAGVSSGSGPQNVMTGSGMQVAPGMGGGVRGSEIFKSGAGFAANFARLFMFVAMNTTVGRMVDGFIGLHGGRSVFEQLFVKHDSRMQSDMQALRDMQGSGGTVRVSLPNGQEGQMVSIRAGENGQTIITLTCQRGTGSNQTQDGQITVTVGRDGRVESLSYMIAGVAPCTNANPNGNGTVTVSQRQGQDIATVRDENGHIVSTMTEPPSGSEQ